MKKFFTTILLVMMAITTRAYDVEVDGIYYNLDKTENSATVTYKTDSYGSYSGSITIPETITVNNILYKVTEIGSSAFRECSGLTSVIIPTSITSISVYAFAGCSSLASVTIPNTVTNILSNAFSNCSNLKTINVPDNVSRIYEYTFSQCTSLESITLGKNITAIEDGAFRGCENLKSVYISDLSAWCKTSFSKKTGSVAYGTVSYTLTSNPLQYGADLYVNGNKLINFIVPDDVTIIQYFAFTGCTSIEYLNLTKQLQNICQGAFDSCAKLKKIDAYSSCSYGTDCFRLCTNLEEFNNYGNLVYSGYEYNSPFAGCTKLNKITLSIQEASSSTPYESNQSCQNYLRKLYPYATEYVIQDGVTNIGEERFYNCDSLQIVHIPTTIQSISRDAFVYCRKLKKVVIKDIESWLKIKFGREEYYNEYSSNPLSNGADLYIDENKLTKLTVPTTITTLNKYSMYGCKSLEHVIIPSTVSTISPLAFCECSNLISFTNLSASPQSLSSGQDISNATYCTLYVPQSSVETYKVTEYWKEFKEIKGINEIALTDNAPDLISGSYNDEHVTYTRTTTANGYATFCMPFDVNTSALTSTFDKIYTFDSKATYSSDGTLEMTASPVAAGTTIAAGTPWIALCSSNNTVLTNSAEVTFGDTTPNPEPTALTITAKGGADVSKMVVKIGGTYSKQTGLDDTKYRAFTTTAIFGPASWVNCFRAYVYKDDTASPAKITRFAFNLSDETTGINNISDAQNSSNCSNGSMYNLNGQRVNASAKGIVIVNGKKIIK